MPTSLADKLRARRKLLASLQKRVAQHRKQCELTQAELAKRLGVTQATISRIERGKRLPSAQLLTALAQALRTTEDKLCQ